MKKERYSFSIRSWLLSAVGSVALLSANAQGVILEEHFTGGVSTTGFTVESTAESACGWVYAPGAVTVGTFNTDLGGAIPSGGGFDGDFAYIDSDVCGTTGITVNSTLISPSFNASGATMLMLSFAHQFHERMQSFGKVEVYNGTAWTQVALYTQETGYPNPAVTANIDITAAAGGSAAAQVRFQFSAGWDWWWALDNIIVADVPCAAPGGLAVSNVTTSSAVIDFAPEGGASYEWVVTTGAWPGMGGDVATGTTSGGVASGLSPGTPYTVFVRSLCEGGGESLWSEAVSFTTVVINDECIGAIPLTVNLNYDCTVRTPGTVSGATASNITSTCGGTANDDVWFSFTALDTTHRITLADVAGSATDLYHALWRGTCSGLELVPGSCSDPNTSNPRGLVVNTTYYLQVYTWGSTAGHNTAFMVCIGSDPLVGIGENLMGVSMRVYPNPAQDHITFEVRDANVQRVRMIDAAGRSVLDLPFSRTVSVQALESGAYTALLFDRSGTVIGRSRFVKE